MVNTENRSECETINDSGNVNGVILSSCNKISNGQDTHNPPIVSDSEEDSSGASCVMRLPSDLQSNGTQCKIVTAFTRAFAKQNIHFEKGKDYRI